MGIFYVLIIFLYGGGPSPLSYRHHIGRDPLDLHKI